MSQPQLHILGITGGIGSGKSEALHFLGELPGTVIMEADRLAHGLMQPGEEIYRELVSGFGGEILGEDGQIDRSILGNLVFHDSEKLELLNSIVHPGVKKYILQDIEKNRQGSTRIYIIEAALLIQDGYKEICDEIWYIHVPEEERVQRLLASRGGTAAKWESVLASQPEEDFFFRNSDRVIENDGTVEELGRHLLDALESAGFQN